MSIVGILLSDDLLFASRITGTARALGLELHSVRTPEALEKRAADLAPACVLIDLHVPELDLAKLAPALKQSGVGTIVGYGSHVATEVLKQARTAGCDVVLPRSKFVETLEHELPGWYAASAKPPREQP